MCVCVWNFASTLSTWIIPCINFRATCFCISYSGEGRARRGGAFCFSVFPCLFASVSLVCSCLFTFPCLFTCVVLACSFLFTLTCLFSLFVALFVFPICFLVCFLVYLVCLPCVFALFTLFVYISLIPCLFSLFTMFVYLSLFVYLCAVGVSLFVYLCHGCFLFVYLFVVDVFRFIPCLLCVILWACDRCDTLCTSVFALFCVCASLCVPPFTQFSLFCVLVGSLFCVVPSHLHRCRWINKASKMNRLLTSGGPPGSARGGAGRKSPNKTD